MQIWPCPKIATLSNYQLYQKGINRTTKKYRPPSFVKKNLYFLFPQRVKLLHKSQIPIVMNEIRMLKKKADDMNRAIPESNYEKTKQKICNS